METPTGATERTRWRFLSPEQRRLADDLLRRAEKLRTEDGSDLSIAEAVAVAAAQLGYPLDPAEDVGPRRRWGPTRQTSPDSDVTS